MGPFDPNMDTLEAKRAHLEPTIATFEANRAHFGPTMLTFEAKRDPESGKRCSRETLGEHNGDSWPTLQKPSVFVGF